MLAVVAILLFFCLIVRHKWSNASAKKDEILRLVAATSQEEAEIAKLQVVEEYNSPPPQPQPQSPPQLEKRYHCAVCYCPTTTRCSRCKTVRYCSGRCQIIHWRQGHKNDCQPTTILHASKESKCAEEAASENQFEIHLNDEVKIWFDSMQECDDSGSSSNSMPCFSSSTEGSETSFDTSASEVIESGNHSKADKAGPVGTNSHTSQNTCDSDNSDVPALFPSSSTVYSVNNTVGTNKIKKALAAKTDEGLQSSSCKNKRIGNGDAILEKYERGPTELRIAQSSTSVRTSSSAEDWKNQAQPSSSKLMRSMSFRGSGNHQVFDTELKCSQCSKSSRTSTLDEFWKNEAQLCNGKETRSTSFRSSANHEKMSAKTGNPHTLTSEIEGIQMLSQSSGKGLKTSMRKFVQHFRAPKHSRSHTFDTGKDDRGNNNYKFVFHPKLFMQLYSCDVELHPFGLVNCGNSCYANAVLQCLTFTRPITFYLLQGLHSKTCRKRDWCFICEFELLVRKGQEMNSPLSPVGILSHIQRIGSNLSRGREEDAHEFLRDVVDTMQSVCLEGADVSGSLAEDSTLLGLTFGGYLQSKIKCMKCSGRFELCDRILDLTVEIDGDIDTVEKALAQFTTSETLGGDDKYKCSRCKSYEKAKKKLTVLEAPNILTVVLKRFQSGNLEKLNKLVQFPVVLNLAPYMSGMGGDTYPVYHLYAVVVHLNTMNAAYCGHYISYVKDFRGDWFRIDDSMVSPVDLETVLSAEAYILFYARHTPHYPTLPRTGSLYSDEKSKRNMENDPLSNGAKKKSSKPKPSSSTRFAESIMRHEPSERRPFWIPPNNLTGSDIADSEGWAFHSKKLRNPILDSSSDSSSIFSASDAGSYSTDSTKDSSAEDISDYIFGSNWYR